jgi:predicted RNA-binding protein YlxR (DUF448 family)
MGIKKIPLRTCIVSREVLPKMSLLRVVEFNGVVSIDLKGKSNGRGVYLKKSLDVIVKARKIKALEKALKIQIDDAIYDQLETLAKNDFISKEN